jgi:putative endonuclease
MTSTYYVYLIVAKRKDKLISYVGYTSNLLNRVRLHNQGRGAKFTKGNIWKVIYKKRYKSKSLAMINEYILKKNYKLRKQIKEHYTINE